MHVLAVLRIEKAHEAKKSTWAQFQTKASKKKVPGFVSTGVKRDSIFKTPDAPDAKVCVRTHFSWLRVGKSSVSGGSWGAAAATMQPHPDLWACGCHV